MGKLETHLCIALSLEMVAISGYVAQLLLAPYLAYVTQPVPSSLFVCHVIDMICCIRVRTESGMCDMVVLRPFACR